MLTNSRKLHSALKNYVVVIKMNNSHAEVTFRLHGFSQTLIKCRLRIDGRQCDSYLKTTVATLTHSVVKKQ